jgi:hypothetical protein
MNFNNSSSNNYTQQQRATRRNNIICQVALLGWMLFNGCIKSAMPLLVVTILPYHCNHHKQILIKSSHSIIHFLSFVGWFAKPAGFS